MPAAIAGRFVKNMKQMMASAIVLGMLFTVVGLWLSYTWNLTSGASIILVAGAAYLISLVCPALPGGRARAHKSE
jgi:zinc transport system permease protein